MTSIIIICCKQHNLQDHSTLLQVWVILTVLIQCSLQVNLFCPDGFSTTFGVLLLGIHKDYIFSLVVLIKSQEGY